jgi:hypothetical protein
MQCLAFGVRATCRRFSNHRLVDDPRFGSSNATDVLRFGCRRVFRKIGHHQIGETIFLRNTCPQPKLSADVSFQLPNLG